jgi:hypothetical protein
MRCRVYFGSTRSLGSVGVSCAPAAVTAVSVVSVMAPLSARAWSGSFPPIRKKPVAPANTAIAIAIARDLEAFVFCTATSMYPITDRELWFQYGPESRLIQRSAVIDEVWAIATQSPLRDVGHGCGLDGRVSARSDCPVPGLDRREARRVDHPQSGIVFATAFCDLPTVKPARAFLAQRFDDESRTSGSTSTTPMRTGGSSTCRYLIRISNGRTSGRFQ